MKKLTELRHGLWTRVQLSVPSQIRPLLHRAKQIALVLSKPYLTIYQWQGQGQGGPLTVSYAGFEYAKPYLKSAIFTEEPAEREIGRVPIWRPGQLADVATDADISYVVSDESLIRRLSHNNALILPFRTRLRLDVRGEWEEVVQRFRYDARRNDLRKVRKYGYTYEESHRLADFETFYHTMYVPSMNKRHGDLTTLMPFEEARQYFQHGVLLLIQRDQRCVAGVVCYIDQKIIYAIVVGVLDGDPQLMKEGAMSAIYHAHIHWANQQGYDSLDFWGSRPYLKDLFMYKRKWGAAVGVPSGMPQRIWLKVRRDTPAVRQFMKDNPCIILDDKGELWGLVITDDPDNVAPEDKETWHKRYDTPGLNGLLIRSVADISSPKR